MKILVIDDDSSLRNSLADILQAKGFEAATAATGGAALTRVEQQEIDVALIDLRLDDMPGLDVLRGVKQRSPDTECILLTGHASQDSAIEAINLGAYSYVQKPFDVDHLMLTIRRAAEKRASGKALIESQGRYHTFLNATADIAFLKDEQLRFIFVNEATARFFGIPIEQIIGRDDFALMEPQVADGCRQSDQQALAENKTVTRLETVNGRIYESRKFPVPLQDGRVGVGGYIRDVTEQIQAEAQARLQSTALEASANAIVITDRNAVIQWANPAFTALAGYSLEETVGQNPRELVKSGVQGPDFYDALWQTILNGQVWRGTLVNRRKDGTLYDEEMTITPLPDESGEPQHFIAVKQDITRRKRRERELEALAELSAALGKSLALQPLLESILQAALKAIPAAEKGSLALLLDDRQLQVQAALGYQDPAILDFVFPISWGFAGLSVRQKQPLLIEDVQNDAQLWQDALQAEQSEVRQLRSAVVVPLEIHDFAIGVMSLESQRAGVFSQADLRLMTSFASQAALVIANARLFEETQQRLVELDALHRASQTLLNALLDPEQTYAAVHHAVAQLMPCEAFVIVLVNEQSGDYHAVYLYDQAGIYPPQHIPAGHGLSGRVIPSGETLLIDDFSPEGDVPALHFGDLQHVRSILAVPLRRSGQTVGMMAAESYAPRAFGARQRVMLETLGAQFSAAIANARLFEETQIRLHELEVIATISAALRTAPTRAEMLPIILDQVMILFNADGVSISSIDPATGEIHVELGRGLWTTFMGLVIPPGEGVSARILATRQPYLNNDARRDPLQFRPDLLGECNAVAGVPLIVQDYAMGVLLAGRKGNMNEGELRLLTSIADMSANALQRAALHEASQREIEQLSVLHTIDIAIASSLDLPLTLNVLVQQVCSQLGVHAADILLFRPHSLTLEYAAGHGFHSLAIENTCLRLGEGPAGKAAIERIAISVAGPEISELLLSRFNLAEEQDFSAYFVLPLVAKGEIKGVLELFQRASLPEDEQWKGFLDALATQAAIAIDNAELFEGLQRSSLELEIAYDATIEGWSHALDLRDKETEGHTQRVTALAVQLARAMGIPEKNMNDIRRGALLHDIGKISVPDAILHKPGPLTDEEWEVMRRHPKLAYEMLLPIKYLRAALDIPYSHHEKWDGTGYPRGLKGEQIPLPARIFALVDVWDALTSDRPYRPAWSKQKALEYIREQAGKHFDPLVVDLFLSVIAESDLF